MEVLSFPAEDKPIKRSKSDYSGSEAWLDAHRDPVSSLYTFSACIGEPEYYNNRHVVYTERHRLFTQIYTQFCLNYVCIYSCMYVCIALEDLDGDGDYKVCSLLCSSMCNDVVLVIVIGRRLGYRTT